jgi:hypothetical protein
MRYAVRRLRRKLPLAQIMVGCWVDDAAMADQIQQTAKADFIATSLREATRTCVALAGATHETTAKAIDEALVANG